MGITRNIIFLLMLLILPSSLLWAVEFDVQAEKVRWRYSEYAKDVTGFVEIPSKAEGNGNLIKLRLSTERDLEWFFGVGGSWMDSVGEESWNHGQINELNVEQQDIRVDVQYRMLRARFGVWLANRKQAQNRTSLPAWSGLVGNKLVTVNSSSIVPEIITSNWLGLSLTSVGGHNEQFEARIDAALALNVEVTNPLFVKPFSKKDGYRTGIHFRWTIPHEEVGVSGLNITLRYEYQELGGENTATDGFWPYNRWQIASLGVLYAW